MRDETDLVARMRRGEQRAFDEFFDTYAERLAACRRQLPALEHRVL